MQVLVAARALQGLGAGVIGSIAYVAIARGYPDALKPQMLAIVSSASVIPGLIGPAISGAVADYAGWRWVFLGLAPLPVFAGLLTLPALRRLGSAAAHGAIGRASPRRLGWLPAPACYWPGLARNPCCSPPGW